MAMKARPRRRGTAAGRSSRAMVDCEHKSRLRRQAFERHLERRIEAQAGRVVSVFVAGGDINSPKADDVRQRVHGAGGITRIPDAGGQTIGDREPALDLAQHQQTAIRRQSAAVEPSDDRLARQSVTGQAAAE